MNSETSKAVQTMRDQQKMAYENAVNFIAIVTNQPNYAEKIKDNIRNVSKQQ